MKKKTLNKKDFDQHSGSRSKITAPETDDQEILMFINKRRDENNALKKILNSLNSKGENKKDD